MTKIEKKKLFYQLLNLRQIQCKEDFIKSDIKPETDIKKFGHAKHAKSPIDSNIN
jgi:hypothetical protein